MNGTLTLTEVGRMAWSVALAVLPLAALFLLFQVLFLKLPRREVSRTLTGTLMASAGLFLFLAGVYTVMIVLSLVAPANIVPLAYDAGSVTTGVLTAPVVLALALGLASVLAERSAVDDGFGLLGLASVGPIIAVLLLGLLL